MTAETMAGPACQAEWADPEWWFSGEDRQRRIAHALCQSCPAAGHCLDLALRGEAGLPDYRRYGIYAGTTPRQRARIAAGDHPRPTWPSDPMAGTPTENPIRSTP